MSRIPPKILKKGQIVQAAILNIDAANRRLSLGIKQLQPDAWETFFRSHQVGDVVQRACLPRRQLRRVRRTGAGHRGVVPQFRDPGRARNAAATNRRCPSGEEFDFKIIRLNEAEKKIGLSMQAVADDEERSRLEDYHRQAAAATMTIEEVINLKGQGETRS